MSHDMEHDIFGDTDYGKLALKRIADPHPDFRLYSAGWLGKGNDRHVMRVTGAVFRRALRGPNIGKLSKLVKGTERTAYLTAAELADKAAMAITPRSTTDARCSVRETIQHALDKCVAGAPVPPAPAPTDSPKD
jgi:hypothetical protein